LYQERVIGPKEKEAAQLRAQGKAVPAELAARRDAPQSEIEALITQTLSVTTEDLDDLARSRAEAVQDELTEAYGIDPERVFISSKPGASRGRQVALQLECPPSGEAAARREQIDARLPRRVLRHQRGHVGVARPALRVHHFQVVG